MKIVGDFFQGEHSSLTMLSIHLYYNLYTFIKGLFEIA